MKLFKKAKKGFTLVELVVVIAVIAILAAVSVGAYFGVTESANNSKLEQEAKQVYTAIQTVALTPNEIASLNKEGLKIEEANISTFETELEKNLGTDITVTTGTVSTVTGVVVNLSTSAYSVSPAAGTPVVYKTFEYYNSEVGGKKAVADVVTGDCKVIASTAENIPTQDPSESEPPETPIDPDAPLYNDGWHLVTDKNELENNDQIIIASSYNEIYYAISTNQKSSNRGVAEISVVETTASLSEHVQPITVKTNDSNYSFLTSKGYLSSNDGANRLLSVADISNTSKWNISINEGIASITSLGSSRTVMQFNHDTENNYLFSCYASAQEKYGQLSIYKNYGDEVEENAPSFVSINWKDDADVSDLSFNEITSSIDYPPIIKTFSNGSTEGTSKDDFEWTSSSELVSVSGETIVPTNYGVENVTITATLKEDNSKTLTFNISVNIVESTGGEDEDGDSIETVLDTSVHPESSGTGYTTWTYNSNDIGFAGYSASNNDTCIQLNSKNNYGIVVTSNSKYYASKITVVWKQTNSNVLDVYGSNNAYSGTDNLYGNNKGTLLGSLSSSTTVLTIEENYSYIGLRSKSGAIYLTSITIEWVLK